MFFQTQTARKPPKVPVTVHSHHPVTSAATEWCRLLLYLICSVRHTPYQCIVSGDDAAVFFPFLSLATLTFDF